MTLRRRGIFVTAFCVVSLAATGTAVATSGTDQYTNNLPTPGGSTTPGGTPPTADTQSLPAQTQSQLQQLPPSQSNQLSTAATSQDLGAPAAKDQSAKGHSGSSSTHDSSSKGGSGSGSGGGFPDARDAFKPSSLDVGTHGIPASAVNAATSAPGFALLAILIAIAGLGVIFRLRGRHGRHLGPAPRD